MSDAGSSDTTELETIDREIDGEIKRIEDEAAKRAMRSEGQWRADLFFRATTAILAVASPALVTYSTAQGVGDLYKLAAIILSGIAGASATLQAIFAFQQNYVHNAVDGLDLRDVAADLAMAKKGAAEKAKPMDQYAALKQALTEARKSYRDIVARQRALLARQMT